MHVSVHCHDTVRKGPEKKVKLSSLMTRAVAMSKDKYRENTSNMFNSFFIFAA